MSLKNIHELPVVEELEGTEQVLVSVNGSAKRVPVDKIAPGAATAEKDGLMTKEDKAAHDKVVQDVADLTKIISDIKGSSASYSVEENDAGGLTYAFTPYSDETEEGATDEG